LCATCVAAAQTPGTVTPESHPALTTYDCTLDGCTAITKSVVIDQNWRWIHNAGGYDNCFDSDAWDATYCPDAETCNQNCELEGISAADYTATYGVSTAGDALTLDYVTGSSVGSRMYLMKDTDTYEAFKLKNKEFTFDVNVSSLACGLNGALYFVAMDTDGGMRRHPSNTAGAKFGTGYCDAQSPQDLHYVDGLPNVEGWSSTSSTGQLGSSCVEMDVWEANAFSTALTPHSCGNITSQTRCGGDGDSDCSGLCDTSGCDFNPFRLGNTTFYGQGSSFLLDTSKPMTVVTQFITDDGTDTGELIEIRRFYKQGSTIIPQPTMPINGKGSFDSISDDYCAAEDSWFGATEFRSKGGMTAMDSAFTSGMVLVLSIWDDYATNMNWLDSTSPTDSTASGAKRGTCATTAGDPNTLRTDAASASVTFSNIRFGSISSTLLDVTLEMASGDQMTINSGALEPSPTPTI